MKKVHHIIVAGFMVALIGCSANKEVKSSNVSGTEVRDEDKAVVSLLNQIRRLPGIQIQGGVPVLNMGTNSVMGASEPLYIVDDLIIGNSFDRVSEVVNSMDVSSIKVLKGSEASYFGSRGASGVIKISTKS